MGVQEAFNEVLPGDVVDSEIASEEVKSAIQRQRRPREARVALLKRKIAACKNAKVEDVLSCLMEEANDKILPREDNGDVRSDADTKRSLRDAVENHAFDSLRACAKASEMEDCLNRFGEAIVLEGSGTNST